LAKQYFRSSNRAAFLMPLMKERIQYGGRKKQILGWAREEAGKGLSLLVELKGHMCRSERRQSGMSGIKKKQLAVAVETLGKRVEERISARVVAQRKGRHLKPAEMGHREGLSGRTMRRSRGGRAATSRVRALPGNSRLRHMAQRECAITKSRQLSDQRGGRQDPLDRTPQDSWTQVISMAIAAN